MPDKTIEERIAFLEKEYERICHNYELLAIYVPKFCGHYEKFMASFYRWKDAMMGDSKYTRALAGKAWEKGLGDDSF